VHLRTQQRGSAEKSGLRDVKRADFIRYWRRSGLKTTDKLKIFAKKNVRNHSYHKFYPDSPRFAVLILNDKISCHSAINLYYILIPDISEYCTV